MYDREIRGAIKSTRIKVKEDGAFQFKTVRLALERELDDDVASIIGPSARKALEALRDGGFSKVVLPIDGVSARGVLDGKTKVTLDKMQGVKVTTSVGKAKEDEEAPLKVKIEYEFPFDAAAWAMIGAEAGSYIGITLTRNQLDLPGTSKPEKAEAKQSAKAKKGNGKKASPPAEDDNPQKAATPEEAEEVRAQRLREERAADEDAWTDHGPTVS